MKKPTSKPKRKIKELAIFPVKTKTGWVWFKFVHRLEEAEWVWDFNDESYGWLPYRPCWKKYWWIVGYEKI
jgi:hypothetical protein